MALAAFVVVRPITGLTSSLKYIAAFYYYIISTLPQAVFTALLQLSNNHTRS